MSASKKWMTPFSRETYQRRRQEFVRQLSNQEPEFTALIWSGSELMRNADTAFPFRASSDFLYLTGLSEPDTLILFQRKDGKVRSAIGVRPRDLSGAHGSEIWEGERIGVERAPKLLGFDEAFDIHQRFEIVKSWIKETRTLVWSFGLYPDWDQKLVELFATLQWRRRGLPEIENIRDYRPTLHEIRRVKSAEEVEVMRRSASIASMAHVRGMKATKPGAFEYQIAAEIEREFKKFGAMTPSYPSIVATGANACTLHYTANDAELKRGDLLLVDAGAEYFGYASDITRTYPVSGHFNPAQREAYEWVLKSQLDAIKSVKPGALLTTPHEVATRTLSVGLEKMGFFKRKTAEQIYKQGLWRHYMPHRTSHWLGLDVHDSGTYWDRKNPKRSAELEPGNVITIEPGLYFRPDDRSVPQKYRGIGIRIEDDVLVTRRSFEVLTANCPKQIKEIEALCAPKL